MYVAGLCRCRRRGVPGVYMRINRCVPKFVDKFVCRQVCTLACLGAYLSAVVRTCVHVSEYVRAAMFTAVHASFAQMCTEEY